MHTAELTVRSAKPTEDLLMRMMGYARSPRGNRARFEAAPGGAGRYVT